MTKRESVRPQVDRCADLVAAYVSYNAVRAADVPHLIAVVSQAILALSNPKAPEAEKPVGGPSPAEIKQSVRPEGLVSFVDGKTYKTLKRHLTKHGYNPATYRARYGLPSDYPMVASKYAERRSALAKQLGFGRAASDA